MVKHDFIVAVDFGRGLTKGVLDENARTSFASVVARDVERRYGAILTPMNANGDVHIIITNKEGERRIDRLVGKAAIEQNRMARAELAQKRDPDDVVALVGEALYKLGVSKNVALVVGAPIDYYKALRDSGEYERLLIGHWVINGRELDVTELVVLPEAVGTFYGLALTLDGKFRDRDLMDGIYAVVDIGMFTTDVVWFNDSQFIEPRSFSLQYGVHSILDALKAFLLNEHGQDVPYFRLVDPLQDGHALLGGETIYFNEITEEAAGVLAESIISSLKSNWRDMLGLRTIFVTGGGSYYTFGYFRNTFGSIAKPVDNSEWSNAVGFRAFGQRRFGKG